MKKIFVLIATVWILIAALNSCSKTSNSPLIGNWSKIVITGDTAYLKVSDNSNFTYGSATGLGYVQQAGGTYAYTASQFTFTVQTAIGSGNNCIGYAASYTYAINSTALTLGVLSDTCGQSGTVPRSAIVTGVWAKQ